METKNIGLDTQSEITDQYVQIRDWFKTAPVCVDGRHGPTEPSSISPVFPQTLGGSLFAGVLWAMKNNSTDFLPDVIKAINTLRDKGFPAGVHRGSHRTAEVSDCGFADNLGPILQRLAENADEIKELINEAAPSAMNEAVWTAVVSSAKELSSNILDNGERIVTEVAAQCQAQVQSLMGDHEEIAAMVNLVPETTLDTASLISAGRQAFSMDLWYVTEQAKALDLDAEYAKLAALGLYIATEMILVENKKGYRLPIIVRS